MLNHIFRKAVNQRVSRSGTPCDYFITTPIFYVNSAPHIGHLHTILLADAINIFTKLKLGSQNTLFTSGTDEHGIKIKTAATKSGQRCQHFCDLNSAKFRQLFYEFDITLTDFVRTTEDRHRATVQSVWSELEKNGYIYKSTYSGWYCNTDETFVPESQIVKKTTDSGEVYFDQNDNIVTWSSEENYLFRLSSFTDRVKSWLNHTKPILPEKFNTEAIRIIENSRMEDISVSRPRSRLDWAISVPGDSSQTIYVWLDALSNYLTSAGYPCEADDLRRWPIDCQVIGKDIIKFHALYWPAFLMALSLPLPKRLICHSHWLIDSLKMSKSRGNVVDPFAEKDVLGTSGLRYYLLRSATPHSDTGYSQMQATRLVNAELADNYGNLLSRSCAPAINPDQVIPIGLIEPIDENIIEIKERLQTLSTTCRVHYEEANFYKGVDAIMNTLRLNNKLYEESKPWKLVKLKSRDDNSCRQYLNLQAITFETLRICSILLLPIIPQIANEALMRLNTTEVSWSAACPQLELCKDKMSTRSIRSEFAKVLVTKIK